MFALEMKRILKTRLVMVLLITLIILAAVLAYLPVTFSYVSYFDGNGNVVSLEGYAALKYCKEHQADLAGEVTEDKVREAVLTYQEVYSEFDVNSSYELPAGVAGTRLLHVSPFIHGVRETYADPNTGSAPGIREVDAEKIEGYYSDISGHLRDLMKLEQGEHPSAGKLAESLYQKVDTPYLFYPGIDTDAMDYQIILAFLAMLLCTVIAAPVFTSDYQTGADDILRCTKNGRRKLAITKAGSALCITSISFLLAAAVFIIITDSLFGWESTKTSMQMLYSMVNLLNMNIGELQCFTALAGFLALMATVSLTLFLSSRIKNMVTALSTALLFSITPVILYVTLPDYIGKWIYSLLPASGLGLQTSILYSVIDFEFLNIGNFSVWLPQAMLLGSIIEIPVFIILTVKSYDVGVK